MQTKPSRPELVKNSDKTMTTATYHVSNLGSYAPSGIADNNGYVTYHKSPRYGRATEAQLDGWACSRIAAVRNAAITEQAERRLAEWQRANA